LWDLVPIDDPIDDPMEDPIAKLIVWRAPLNSNLSFDHELPLEPEGLRASNGKTEWLFVICYLPFGHEQVMD